MPGNETVNALHPVPRAEIPADDWDDVVHGSPDGWVFGLYGWQDLILAVERWELREHSFALRENGRCVAVVPLQFNPSSGVMASSGWGGAGPILDGSLSAKARRRVMGEAIARCVEAAESCGAKGLEFPLLPATETSVTAPWGVNPLVLYGFEDRSGLSRVIDLSLSEQELSADLTPDARRQIRLAREAGYVVERADWADCLDHYYELHCATYRRTGVPPHPREYFAGIAGRTAPAGYSVLWRVRDASGAVVSYHNDACFRMGAYYHTGCSADGVGETGAGYLLFWEAMMGARAAGARWYDCGAIFPNTEDPKQRGLTTFKTKFGGETHRLFQGRMQFASADRDPPPVDTPSLAIKACRRLRRLVAIG